MRILWVKLGGIWPLDVGGRLRSYHILSELSQRHRITLLTTHRPEENEDQAAKQLPHCERVISFPYSAPKAGTLAFAGGLVRSWASPLPVDLLKWRVPALRNEVCAILNSGQVEVCIADFLYAAVNIPETSVPVILFAHNVEHVIWKRLADYEKHLWRRALLELEWRKIRRTERHACRRSQAVIAVSAVDAGSFIEQAPEANVRSIPTGVDTEYFCANGTPESEGHLVFSGAMDWYPNEDAMLFFIDEILPLIRQQLPTATLTIVGRNPSARLQNAAHAARVRVTGTVEDVRSFIDEGAVYVVPLRIGGGTRLKIFEALSMGKAVVSTSVGAEGLPLLNGEHYVCANDPKEFSRAVVSLLGDPSRRKELGAAGRDLVSTHYSWRAVAQQFELHCQEALH